ncbi:MAG: hypothetical protein IJC84_01895 [Clostridia bacterium]|nr:hypothetical protein [Clostridia bacterium]
MKRFLALFLATLLCFCLISCDEKDENATAATGDGGSAATAEGAGILSGRKAWLPSSITRTDAEGNSYVMQTVEMNGTVAKICFYNYYNGKTTLSSGYEVDLAKTNPFELSRLRAPERDGSVDPGLRRFTVSEDGTSILEESAYRMSEGINSTTDYSITYDDQGRIAKVVINDKYMGDETSESVEERIYQYGDTGYTISYVDGGWSQRDDDDSKVLRYRVYEIPYEGGEITLTETYQKEDGTRCYPEDFHTYSDGRLDKLVYKMNRRGFCTSNVLYFKDGTTIADREFFNDEDFTAEFNEAGMPVKYVTQDEGGNVSTGSFTYDDKGNLTQYRYEGARESFTMELQWQEFPAELAESFAAIFNFEHYAIREAIEEKCPEIMVGPQQLIYQKDAIVK